MIENVRNVNVAKLIIFLLNYVFPFGVECRFFVGNNPLLTAPLLEPKNILLAFIIIIDN